MQFSRRQFLQASGVSISILAGCSTDPAETPTESRTTTPSETRVSTSTSTATPTGIDGEISVEGSEWVLDPETFQATVDQSVTVHFENVGEVAHNLTVGKFPVDERSAATQDEEGTILAKTETVQAGVTTSITFTPESTGTYPFWCDVSGHREAGMIGEMIVIE